MAQEKPPLNLSAMREAAAIDLAARARARAEQEANPWHGVQIRVHEIPTSALYDIFSAEAIDAHNNALNALQQMVSGQVPPTVNRDQFRFQIESLLAASQIKATLALASATMALAPPDAPRWFGPDGTRESGYAQKYLDAQKAKKEQE